MSNNHPLVPHNKFIAKYNSTGAPVFEGVVNGYPRVKIPVNMIGGAKGIDGAIKLDFFIFNRLTGDSVGNTLETSDSISGPSLVLTAGNTPTELYTSGLPKLLLELIPLHLTPCCLLDPPSGLCK